MLPLPFLSPQFFRTSLTKAIRSKPTSILLTGAGKQQSTELWNKHNITMTLYVHHERGRRRQFVLHLVYTLSALAFQQPVKLLLAAILTHRFTPQGSLCHMTKCRQKQNQHRLSPCVGRWWWWCHREGGCSKKSPSVFSLPLEALRIAKLTFDLTPQTRATSFIPWMWRVLTQSEGRGALEAKGRGKRESTRVWFDFDGAGSERSHGGLSSKGAACCGLN